LSRPNLTTIQSGRPYWTRFPVPDFLTRPKTAVQKPDQCVAVVDLRKTRERSAFGSCSHRCSQTNSRETKGLHKLHEPPSSTPDNSRPLRPERRAWKFSTTHHSPSWQLRPTRFRACTEQEMWALKQVHSRSLQPGRGLFKIEKNPLF
jgi:hypothetical protein